MKRFKGLIGRDVFYNENTLFHSKKELFLSNPVNEQKSRRKKSWMLSSKGEEALACMFGTQSCEGLNLLRFRKISC